MSNPAVEQAKEHFGRVLEQQLVRIEKMKAGEEETDYAALKPIIIGIIGGDGIGPYIAEEARRILKFLLAEEQKSGKVEFRDIEGLTIEYRAEVEKPIPDDVLEEIKKCHVTLKGDKSLSAMPIALGLRLSGEPNVFPPKITGSNKTAITTSIPPAAIMVGCFQSIFIF